VTSHADVEEELRQIEGQLGNFLWDKRRGVALARVALPATSNNHSVRELLKDVESLRRRLAALEVRAAATVRSRILRLVGRCDRLIDELKAR
jgi:hypothetical protein